MSDHAAYLLLITLSLLGVILALAATSGGAW